MNFKRNFPLAEICTLNIKEIASYYCEISDFEDIEEIRSFISRKNIPFLLLGEGTNIVPTDTFNGLVIQNQIKGIELLDSFTIKVSSGENWHDFVEWTVKNKKYGLENLALIPGTVGAGPIQNIGAYGSEIGAYIKEVTFYDFHKDKVGAFSQKDCNFSYRSSVFKEKPELFILSVTFELNNEPKLNLSYDSLKEQISKDGLNEKNLKPVDIFNTVKKIRTRVLPNHLKQPNVGSFFKNVYLKKEELKKLKLPSDIQTFEHDDIVKISSAHLMEKFGWKGFRRGSLGISEQHSLVLITYEETSGEEIVTLSNEIIKDIYSKTGLQLEVEPTFV